MSDTVKVDRKLKWAQNAVETITCHNKSGGTVAPGDVVIFDSANSTDTEVAFTTTTIVDSKMVLGVCIENIATNGYGEIQTKGPIASIIKVNGTTDIAIGDLLGTYSTVKIGQKATVGKGGAFAVALEAYAANDSSGTIKAWLMGGASRVDTAAYAGSFASPTLSGTVSVTGATSFNSTATITCAGSASETDAITLTLGDITLSDGQLSVTDSASSTGVVTIASTTGTMGNDVGMLYIDSNGTLASGANMIRLDPTGGTPNAGAILFEIVGAGMTSQSMYIDGDSTAVDVAHIHSGGVLEDGYAVLGITNDGNLATGGALLNLTLGGTVGSTAVRVFEIDGQQDCIAVYIDSDAVAESAVQITGQGTSATGKAMLHVGSTGTLANGSALVRIESGATATATAWGLIIDCNNTNMKGLWVEKGTTEFTDAVTILTTSKLYFTDTNQYIYAPAANKIDINASTWTKIVGGPFIVGVSGAGYDVSFYANTSAYLTWFDVSGNSNKGVWYFGADQKGVDVFWYGATASNYMKWNEDTDNLAIVNTTCTGLTLTSGLTGSSADNAMDITVTDAQTNTSGYARALYLSYTAAGAKSGTAEANALGIDLGVSGNTPHAFNMSLYNSVSGSPTIDYFAGIYLYFDAHGSATVNEKWAVILEMDNTNVATSDGYLRCYTHSTNLLDTVIWMGKTAGCADYLLTFQGSETEPCSTNATNSTARTHRIKVRCGGSDGYISVFSA